MEQQYLVTRERFITRKDEEELRIESLFTQTMLFVQKNEELIPWNEARRKEYEVSAKAAVETLRGNLGDENSKTSSERVSLEKGNSKKQYTLTEGGARLVVWTDGSSFHKDIPMIVGAGAGSVFLSKGCSKHSFCLERPVMNDKPKNRVGGMCSSPHGTRLQA